MNMQSADKFLAELNAETAPMLVSRYVTQQSGGWFIVELAPSKYIVAGRAVCTTSELDKLIYDLCIKHFAQAPSFNNTHTIWWL